MNDLDGELKTGTNGVTNDKLSDHSHKFSDCDDLQCHKEGLLMDEKR